MLENKLKRFLYLVLRNDWAWKMLSAEEQQQIFDINASFNTERPDYRTPENYDGGNSFDSEEDRLGSWKGKTIDSFLHATQPESVLEVGPGSGFFTRQLLDYPSVKKYSGVDINKYFLEFIRERIEKHPDYSHIETEWFHSGALEINDVQYDAIILLSTVHHIPNREEFFSKFAEKLKSGGVVLAIDPSHGVPRIVKMAINCFKKCYLAAEDSSLSTHHYCSLGEYRRICSAVPQLHISSVAFESEGKPEEVRNRLSKIFNTTWFDSVLSTRIAVVFQKK